MAEGAGFEPAVPYKRDRGLANLRTRPTMRPFRDFNIEPMLLERVFDSRSLYQFSLIVRTIKNGLPLWLYGLSTFDFELSIGMPGGT